MTRSIISRAAPAAVPAALALVAALALGACSEEEPRDAGRGDGSGYGAPQD